MNNQLILEIKNLVKSYKSFSLDNVSFSLPGGFVMGFIGPNGAGKTTTIKALLDIITVDSGEIKLFGSRNDETSIKDKIGVVMDSPFYVEEWTLKDVEMAVAPFCSEWNHNSYIKHLKEFNLQADKKVKDLSRGMKVKLMIAVALSHNAQLLILDEPTSGLDPVARDELMEILRNFVTDDSKAILFSTHITADLEKIADYITFIINGKIIFTGLKDTLTESYCLIKGGVRDINNEQKKLLIGYSEHSAGFEGMLESKNISRMPKDVSIEPVNLEDIIVYMNKGGK